MRRKAVSLSLVAAVLVGAVASASAQAAPPRWKVNNSFGEAGDTENFSYENEANVSLKVATLYTITCKTLKGSGMIEAVAEGKVGVGAITSMGFGECTISLSNCAVMSMEGIKVGLGYPTELARLKVPEKTIGNQIKEMDIFVSLKGTGCPSSSLEVVGTGVAAVTVNKFEFKSPALEGSTLSVEKAEAILAAKLKIKPGHILSETISAE